MWVTGIPVIFQWQGLTVIFDQRTNNIIEQFSAIWGLKTEVQSTTDAECKILWASLVLVTVVLYKRFLEKDFLQM